MLFVARLERTRTGRALIAIREDELAAAAMGVNPTYHKVLAFAASAVLAGAVGALSAHLINTWNSRQGTFDTSVNLMAFVLVGGSRTFVGPSWAGSSSPRCRKPCAASPTSGVCLAWFAVVPA